MKNQSDYLKNFGNRTCSMKLVSSVSDQNVYFTYVCLVNEVRQLAGNDNDMNSMNQDCSLHGAYAVSNGVSSVFDSNRHSDIPLINFTLEINLR